MNRQHGRLYLLAHRRVVCTLASRSSSVLVPLSHPTGVTIAKVLPPNSSPVHFLTRPAQWTVCGDLGKIPLAQSRVGLEP